MLLLVIVILVVNIQTVEFYCEQLIEISRVINYYGPLWINYSISMVHFFPFFFTLYTKNFTCNKKLNALSLIPPKLLHQIE